MFIRSLRIDLLLLWIQTTFHCLAQGLRARTESKSRNQNRSERRKGALLHRVLSSVLVLIPRSSADPFRAGHPETAKHIIKPSNIMDVAVEHFEAPAEYEDLIQEWAPEKCMTEMPPDPDSELVEQRPDKDEAMRQRLSGVTEPHDDADYGA